MQEALLTLMSVANTITQHLLLYQAAPTLPEWYITKCDMEACIGHPGVVDTHHH